MHQGTGTGYADTAARSAKPIWSDTKRSANRRRSLPSGAPRRILVRWLDESPPRGHQARRRDGAAPAGA